MAFKKLNRDIIEVLTKKDINEPTPFESESIPIIKSGANVYCIAPEGSGKTTTLIITTLQKLECRAMGNAPRAVVIVENKEIALEMYDAFLEYTKHTSLRVYVGYEELHLDVQKSEIDMGVDILISTPKSMNSLFLQNGANTSDLRIFSIDDAELLHQKTAYSAILSVTRSIKKCQYVIYAEKMTPILKRLENYFMEYSKVVKF